MAQVLYALAIVACPVGMGLMMWLMMRSGKKDPSATAPSVASEAELAQLRADLDELRVKQRDAPTVVAITQSR